MHGTVQTLPPIAHHTGQHKTLKQHFSKSCIAFVYIVFGQAKRINIYTILLVHFTGVDNGYVDGADAR